MYPSDFRAAPRPVRLTLLAVLCWVRAAELTDGLVELLIGLIHKIDARAEQRVERELLAELHRVRGKEGILFTLGACARGRRLLDLPAPGLHDQVKKGLNTRSGRIQSCASAMSW